MMDVRCLVPKEGGGYRESTWPGVSLNSMGLFQRIPECKSADKHAFSDRYLHICQATDVTALIVQHCWPNDRIHFRAPGVTDNGEWKYPEDTDTEAAFQYLIHRFEGQTARARAIAEFKADRILPSRPNGWVAHPTRELSGYQEAAVSLALPHESLALFFDQGVGKTPPAIQTICQRARLQRRAGRMLRALVVCPQQVRSNWEREFGRFASVAGKVTIIKGTAIKRVELLRHVVISEEDCAFSVGIISYDSATATLAHLQRVPWDALILDESHKFKGPKTNRWKTVSGLRDVASFRMLLTGTPIGNTPMDLWTQLEALGQGLSGFTSYGTFRKFYGKWRDIPNARGIQRLTGLKNMPLLQERLTRLSFAMTREEAGIDLPNLVRDLVEVEMTGRQAEIYSRVSSQLKIEIQDKLSGDVDTLVINSVLTQLLRLAQITSGHVSWQAIFDPETGESLQDARIEQLEPNPKLDELATMLTDPDRNPLSKAIVWACFRPDVEAIYDRLKAEGLDPVKYYGATTESQREEAVRRFNEDPTCRVFVGNPATAGEGLNLMGYDWWEAEPKLQTNCDWQIFYSCNWSSLERGQAEARAYRRGTRTQVRITDLVVPDTIDSQIRDRVEKKVEMAALTLDLSEILNNVLDLDIKP